MSTIRRWAWNDPDAIHLTRDEYIDAPIPVPRVLVRAALPSTRKNATLASLALRFPARFGYPSFDADVAAPDGEVLPPLESLSVMVGVLAAWDAGVISPTGHWPDLSLRQLWRWMQATNETLPPMGGSTAARLREFLSAWAGLRIKTSGLVEVSENATRATNRTRIFHPWNVSFLKDPREGKEGGLILERLDVNRELVRELTGPHVIWWPQDWLRTLKVAGGARWALAIMDAMAEYEGEATGHLALEWGSLLDRVYGGRTPARFRDTRTEFAEALRAMAAEGLVSRIDAPGGPLQPWTPIVIHLGPRLQPLVRLIGCPASASPRQRMLFAALREHGIGARKAGAAVMQQPELVQVILRYILWRGRGGGPGSIDHPGNYLTKSLKGPRELLWDSPNFTKWQSAMERRLFDGPAIARRQGDQATVVSAAQALPTPISAPPAWLGNVTDDQWAQLTEMDRGWLSAAEPVYDAAAGAWVIAIGFPLVAKRLEAALLQEWHARHADGAPLQIAG